MQKIKACYILAQLESALINLYNISSIKGTVTFYIEDMDQGALTTDLFVGWIKRFCSINYKNNYKGINFQIKKSR